MRKKVKEKVVQNLGGSESEEEQEDFQEKMKELMAKHDESK